MKHASVIACALGCAPSAFGAIVNATFTGVGPGGTASISPGGNVGAGQYNFDYNYGDLNWLAPSFGAFCIEVTEPISGGQTATFTVSPIELSPTSFGPAGMGPARADRLSELFGRHYADALDTNENAVAFALAVWETVYDDTPDVSGGAFTVSGSDPAGAVALAQLWLNEVDGTGPHAPLIALDAEGVQDYVIVNQEIPAPGASALAIVGLVGAARRRR